MPFSTPADATRPRRRTHWQRADQPCTEALMLGAAETDDKTLDQIALEYI